MKLTSVIPNHTKAYVFLKESLTPKERTFLAEAGLASDSDIESMLKNIAKELEKKNLTDKSPEDVDLDVIEKEKTEEGINEEQLNEGLVLTLILASPAAIAFLIMSSGIPEPPCKTSGKLVSLEYCSISAKPN